MSTGALTVTAADAPGWYGKVATLGDFAQRRLTPEFVQFCDQWISRALTTSRQQLGERWLDAYLTAPVLRFAWAPGIADASWWFGVLMPSCDNVGRYFPLLIAQPRSRPPLDRIALDHLDAWFEHLAHAATQTLSEHAALETFEDALADAPPWPTPGKAHPLEHSAAANTTHYRFGAQATLNQWLHAVSIQDLHARFLGCSVWWRSGDATRDAVVSIHPGLPDPTAYAQMLTGPA